MTARVVALLVAVFLACTKADPPSPPPPAPAPVQEPAPPAVQAPVQTDRPRYAMREGPFGPETTIGSTFTAPSGTPVYIVNCNGAFGVSLQRLEGNEWVYAWTVSMNACLSAPIVVAPGQRHSGTVTVASGVDAYVSSTMTDTKVRAGTYRVVWTGLYTSFDMNKHPWGEELPLEQRVSAPFPIDAAPPLDPTRPSPAQQPAELASVEPPHGAQAAANTRIRVRFTPNGLRLDSQPHLYVDRDPVESTRSSNGLELSYTPPRHLTPGRHQLRVVYQDAQHNMRWYAWSFIVAE